MERPIAITTASQWEAHVTAVNTGLTFTADPAQSWIIPGLIWSMYDSNYGAPTALDGPLVIDFINPADSHSFFKFRATSQGPGFLPFPRPVKFPKGVGVMIKVTGLPTAQLVDLVVIGAYQD